MNLRLIALFLGFVLLAGCGSGGGGGGSSSTPASPPPSSAGAPLSWDQGSWGNVVWQ